MASARTLRKFLAFLFLMQNIQAGEVRFFVGTYTKKAPDQGIYTGLLDTTTGRIRAIGLACVANDPNFLAVSPDGKTVYASMENDGGAVGAFAADPDGTLRALNVQPAEGRSTCHVWTDSKGRNVLAANYTGGSIISYPVNPDGSLAPRSSFVQFHGSGADPKRQTAPHAHAIYTSPDDRFAYACDLGTDKVWSFAFDPAKGSLTPTDPPAGETPPGSGPRHMAFHPSGRYAYVTNEMGLSVTTFARNPETGTLTPVMTERTVAGDESPDDGVTTAEILLHPSGKWLYVSNRGTDTIAVFALDDNGIPSRIQLAPAGVALPRGMGIDPAGKWMITTGQKDNRIAVLKIDPASGLLTPTDQAAEIPVPVCVVFNRP